MIPLLIPLISFFRPSQLADLAQLATKVKGSGKPRPVLIHCNVCAILKCTLIDHKAFVFNVLWTDRLGALGMKNLALRRHRHEYRLLNVVTILHLDSKRYSPGTLALRAPP